MGSIRFAFARYHGMELHRMLSFLQVTSDQIKENQTKFKTRPVAFTFASRFILAAHPTRRLACKFLDS